MIRKICKKATVWLLAGVIGLSAVTVQAAEVDNGASYPITTNAIEGWPQGPDTYSETAVLMDADTGTILYNKGMDEKRYPASITKIMTALLALENSNLDDQVTFTEECLADQSIGQWKYRHAGRRGADDASVSAGVDDTVSK